jgi:hypothetical protein
MEGMTTTLIYDNRVTKGLIKKPYRSPWLNILSKPFALLIFVICMIFFAEAVVMLLLAHMKVYNVITEALLDSFLLVLILMPLMHFFIVRPFWVQNIKQKELEEKLREYHANLGELVKERTSELVEKNRQCELEIAERKRIEKELQERVEDLEKTLNDSIRWRSVERSE